MAKPAASRRPRPWLAALAAALTGVVAGCSRPPAPELRIGLIVNEGDPAPEETMLASARLAVDRANRDGGAEVGGRRVRVALVVARDGGTPEGAAAAARQLVNREGVVAIVGPNWSSRAIPAAAVAEEARVPLVSPGSTHPATTAGRRYAFRAGFLDQDQGRAIARFARQDLGTQRAAVLFDEADPYSSSLARAFETTFRELGGDVVATERFTTDVRDYRPQLSRIRHADPQALFLPSYPREVEAQARQARELGLGATLLGGDGWDERELGPVLELEGAIFADHWHPDAPLPALREYAEAYRQATGGEPRSSMGPLTYDAVGLVLEAARRTGAADPEGIRRGLSDLGPYPGATGAIQFQGGGDPRKAVAVLRFRAGRAELARWVVP
ncbi:MAG: ABC transporter substrate-binding protein [Deferrisomatales bacterium]